LIPHTNQKPHKNLKKIFQKSKLQKKMLSKLFLSGLLASTLVISHPVHHQKRGLTRNSVNRKPSNLPFYHPNPNFVIVEENSPVEGNDPLSIGLNYVKKILKVSDENLKVKNVYTSSNGVTHIYVSQIANGLEVR